ncbi:hypothetical protein TVAG_256690 [Trichomonas vaginalis G3]|uniref:RING-type domain-containing protein n=1 Tax=Trichomonas vaginalis (strain ATCC PRA-98 / G3) TaxID=412133 RepID=A2FEX5_TRIV3|nr:VPS8 subunit of corvet complex family [Trichomonas vaginalis G3]EAX96529.1 hypothetical protein TVAG_256690 [Trichomonas vaginalis G3]KAI5541103.1 VPS8 subunit of corvet complex family [Trichomonas vaginalis G3]|eukprot:XP_001309459.1 hypothetical protein [Trichomonas vaginalis G3]
MTESEETNFIVITKIKEFPMPDGQPMAIAFNYPLIAIVVSSKTIVTFNFETKSTVKLERQLIGEENVVLCADVSPDRTHIATGHSDGEVVVWSLQSKTSLISTNTSEPISFIAFGSAFSIFHSDAMGNLSRTTVSQNIFKKSVTTQILYNFEQPLTALAYHDNALYVSTSTHTLAYLITPEFRSHWTDHTCTSCFAFLETANSKLIARGVGHNVIISKYDGTLIRTVEFSQTPNVVSMLSENSVLVLFSGNCEMAVGERRFRRHVPKGPSLAFKDKIYVAGSELIQLSIASISQRVENYIQENNWPMALAQITEPDDIDDLQGLLKKYVKSDQFNPQELFKFVERMNMTDFVVQMMFTDKKEQILEAFIESGITKWKLTLEFIIEAAKCIKDDQKLIKFLTSVELNIEWLQTIFNLCFDRGLVDLISELALEYCSDIYMALLVYEYSKNYEKEHNLIRSILMPQNPSTVALRMKQDCVKFLSTVDLYGFVNYDSQSALQIFQIALDLSPHLGFSISTIINHIIPSLDPSSTFWGILIPQIVQYSIIVDDNSLNAINRFIFLPSKSDVSIRREMLNALLKTNQIKDLRKYLIMTRSAGFTDCELKIIELLKDPEELLYFIIQNQVKEFANELKKVTNNDSETISKILVKHCKTLLGVNPDEYTEMVWEYGKSDLTIRVYKNLKDSHALSWHFLHRIFSNHKEFYEAADEQSSEFYAMNLARYQPKTLLDSLKNMKSIPLDKLLNTCMERGILDSALYLCLLTQEIDKGVTFSSEYLLNSLMEQGGDKNVVNEIVTFLSSISSNPDYEENWVKLLSVFQLPLYAIKDDTTKRQNILNLLGDFIQTMTLVVEPVFVTQNLTTLFSFLPFKDSRSLVSRVFKTIREKTEFTRTFSHIVKDESVCAQLNFVKKLSNGHEYDAERCATCGQRLCACNAYAARCGHVFHSECAKSAWCPICQRGFQLVDKKDEGQTLQGVAMLTNFENKVKESEIKPQQKTNQTNLLNPKKLEMPLIGTLVQQIYD